MNIEQYNCLENNKTLIISHIAIKLSYSKVL